MSPRPPSSSKLYAFRLPVELVDQVDEHVTALQADASSRRTVTRAEAVRSLLVEALEVHAKRRAKAAAPTARRK